MSQLIGQLLGAVIGYGVSFFVIAVSVVVAGGEGSVGNNLGSCAIAAAILYFAFAYDGHEKNKSLSTQQDSTET